MTATRYCVKIFLLFFWWIAGESNPHPRLASRRNPCYPILRAHFYFIDCFIKLALDSFEGLLVKGRSLFE